MKPEEFEEGLAVKFVADYGDPEVVDRDNLKYRRLGAVGWLVSRNVDSSIWWVRYDTGKEVAHIPSELMLWQGTSVVKDAAPIVKAVVQTVF